MKTRRLDQLLASLGYRSRREATAMIRDGRVTANGDVITTPDARINPSTVKLDGEPLEFPNGILVMLHKPVGYVCSHSSNEGPTIYELLPPRWLKRKTPVTSVGRLDKETSGVLLITDSGELVHRYTSPRAKVIKAYEVEVDGELRPELIEIFAMGKLKLPGEKNPCRPAKLEILGQRTGRIHLTEGRYHQVRRMFASQNLFVTKLHRTRFGDHELDDLSATEWRVIESRY